MCTRSCRRRCLHCNELFKPDSRARSRQRYCSADDCRRASKNASQARWLAKPGNEDYFRGSANTERNRRWRAANSGYWKRSARARTQQDQSHAQTSDNQPVISSSSSLTQQDLFELQLPVFVGLIASLSASTQQDVIDRSMRHLHALGHEVLSREPAANALLAAWPKSGRTPPNSHPPPFS